ncbi:MAG TPA: hypothetical protein VFI25_02750 [Planctomycetota bacterium]|jgi:hypothetical protein|nr:hypothetical protein [Planctomycetota bacterium]
MGIRVGKGVGSFLACAVLGLAALGARLVQDLPLFELDRNAVDGPASGDDWDKVLVAGTGGGFVHTGVMQDPSPATVFAGGGSKDLNDLPSWGHGSGTVPNKDDITNAYAVAYLNTTDTGLNNAGDQIVYFGADRFANNGDSQIGFWFFQQQVRLNSNGTFLGVHEIGDTLVLSDFSQGGSVSTIRVYEWVGSGGSDGSLDLLYTGADCATTAPDSPLCATVNTAATPSPWPYAPKVGAPGSFPTGSFFEGGINVTRIVPAACCFSSFLAETRSSTSVSATLKDFVLGNLDTCGLTVTVAPDAPAVCAQDAHVQYAYEVCNFGARPLFVNLVDDAGTPGDSSDDLDVDGGAGFSLAPGECHSFARSATLVAGGPTPFAFTNTATATGVALEGAGAACTRAIHGSGSATVTLSTCALEVTKACQDAPSPSGQIQVSGTVCNAGEVAVHVTDVVDDRAGALSFTGPNPLLPGACGTFAGSYVPSSNPSTSIVTATGVVVGGSLVVSDSASATCAVRCSPAIAASVACQDPPTPGQPIPFSGTVTNAGNTNLSGVTVASAHAGLLLGPISLAPSETALFAGSYVPTTTPSTDVVTASGEPDAICNLGPVSDTASSTCGVVCAPAIDVTKSCQNAPAPGQPIPFTGTVTNAGNTNLSGVTVVHDRAGVVLGPIALAPSQSANFSGSYLPATSPATDTVTASGQPDAVCNLGPVSDTAGSTCSVLCVPAIHVTKSCQNAPAPGQPITFTGTVTNAGNTSLSGVTVVDDRAGVVLGPISLAPSQSASFSGSYVPTTTPSTDTVTATGQPDAICGLGPVSDAASSTCAVICAPAIDVTKSCQNAPAPGQPISFTGTVTNTGNTHLSNVTVFDDRTGQVLGPIALAPNQSASFSGSYVPTATPSTDTVVASGQPDAICGLGPVTDAASSTCSVQCTPCLAVTNNCSNAAAAGKPIPFSGAVTNCGNTTLVDVAVVSDRVGTLLQHLTLAPNQSASFSGTYRSADPCGQPATNTVTATGASPGICDPGHLLVATDSSTCTHPCAPYEGCSPGYWRAHTERWDSPADTVAIAAGFTTTTSFNLFFRLTPAESGFANSYTMRDAVNASGSGAKKVARFGTAVLLNYAAGLNVVYPPEISNAEDLWWAIRNAFLENDFEPLGSQLSDTITGGICPLS